MKWIIVFVCCMLSACSQKRPNLTREQWIDMTSHTFKNTTVNEVLKTGEKVLQLSDPDDIKIYHLQNKLVGSRKYLVYMVIAADMGSYNFDLSAIQKGPDVETQLLIGHSNQPILPAITYTPGNQGNGIGGTAAPGVANVGNPMDWREQYDLFFSRIDALLYNKPWIICDEIRENKPVTAVESLCYLADDRIPDGVKLSVKSAQIVSSKTK